MENTFDVDTDHKPLVPQLSGYMTPSPLRIRIRVRLQGFNYILSYVPGKEGSENNEVYYHSQHPEPLAMQMCQACKREAQFELRETVEEFEKDVMAKLKSSVPEAVTWQKLLEEKHSDTELSDLKDAIARGYFSAQGKRALEPQYDSIFTELGVDGGLVVRGPGIAVPRSQWGKVVKLAHEGKFMA